MGLEKRTELNGRCGQITGTTLDSTRYKVRIDGATEVRLKPANLVAGQPVVQPAWSSAVSAFRVDLSHGHPVKGKIYAVAVGTHGAGLFDSWETCGALGCSSNLSKKFEYNLRAPVGMQRSYKDARLAALDWLYAQTLSEELKLYLLSEELKQRLAAAEQERSIEAESHSHGPSEQRRKLSQPHRERLAARQNYLCASCEQSLDGVPWEVDHKIRLSRSCNSAETHSDDNLQVLCVDCHAKKTRKEQDLGLDYN